MFWKKEITHPKTHSRYLLKLGVWQIFFVIVTEDDYQPSKARFSGGAVALFSGFAALDLAAATAPSQTGLR